MYRFGTYICILLQQNQNQTAMLESEPELRKKILFDARPWREGRYTQVMPTFTLCKHSPLKGIADHRISRRYLGRFTVPRKVFRQSPSAVQYSKFWWALLHILRSQTKNYVAKNWLCQVYITVTVQRQRRGKKIIPHRKCSAILPEMSLWNNRKAEISA